jgi:hypothetical protein
MIVPTHGPGETIFEAKSLVGPAKEITIREGAPENLRDFVLQTAIDLGWSRSALRDVMWDMPRTKRVTFKRERNPNAARQTLL